MLNLVRKHADSWMIRSILWVIVLAFVGTIFYSWGMGGSPESRGGVVATVNGIKIKQGEYQKTFNNLIEFYRDQFRNQFSRDLVEKLDLKTAALDGLIQKRLLLHQAEKHHIRVSDEELISRIKAIPTFQRDNKFNPQVYQNYLKYRRVTPMDFEENQREAMLLEKIEQLIKDQTVVSESEVLEAFKQEEDKIKFDYLVLTDDYFKAPEEIAEVEKKKFYEKNQFLFKKPEQIKIQYVKLKSNQFENEIAPHEEDVKDYYESQIGQFYEEEKFQASHMLFSTQPGNSKNNSSDDGTEKKLTDDEAQAKKKAEGLLQKIREGADFAALAKTHSDDKISGKEGGKLGQFERGRMVAEFEKALLKLKVGEISGPVLTQFGYHLIRLDEKKEARTKPLEEVKDSIIQKIKEIKSRQRVRRVIKRISRSAESDNDLARAALEMENEVKTTELITREDHDVPDVGTVPEFFNTAFQLKENQVSQPVFTAEASYILTIKERRPAYIQDITDVQELLANAILLEKSKTLTTENVKVLAVQIAENKSLQEVAQSMGLDIKHTPFFSFLDSIPGVGAVQSIKDKVFTLKPGETTSAFANNKHYLIKLVDVLPGSEPDDLRIKSLYAKLRKDKGKIIFDDWMNHLRESSNIMIDRTLL